MSTAVAESHLVKNISIAEIRVDKFNPDHRTQGPEFEEFCADVAAHGVLQAVLVRAGRGDGWHLIAGHRRLAAAKRAGQVEIPAVISPLGAEHDEELRLVENLHREGLHALDEAEGYERLLRAHGGSAETIARRVGRTPRYVYDRLKLTNLTADAKRLFREGKIHAGHAVILARLTATEQARAIDPYERALFEHENTLFNPDDEFETSTDDWANKKARTPAELQAWVDQSVRASHEDVDAMLFPVTAEEIAAAKKVIPITRSGALQDSAKSKERTFGPRSWKRADGERGSKTCSEWVTGFVVAGPGRNESFKVCVAKTRCTVHWKDEIKQAAKREKEREKEGAKPAPAQTAKREANDKAQRARAEATQRAHVEYHRLIEAEIQSVARQMNPESFIRAMGAYHAEGGNLSYVLNKLKVVVKGRDGAAAWANAAPLADLQVAVALVECDMADAESIAPAFGIDIKAMWKECEKSELEKLKAKATEETKPRKNGTKKG